MDSSRTPSNGHLSHFAINADDVDKSREFYSAVFGWSFEPWGPPGFFHIKGPDGGLPGPIGALQPRRDLGVGVPVQGFECTIAVTDVRACMAAVEAGGGRVLLEPTSIPGVGEVGFFADPSGVVCGAMQYAEG